MVPPPGPGAGMARGTPVLSSCFLPSERCGGPAPGHLPQDTTSRFRRKLMMLIEETTVPQSALPLGLFKEHLRLGSGFSDDGLQDGLLEGFLRSAMAAIEGRTSKVLIERDFA